MDFERIDNIYANANTILELMDDRGRKQFLQDLDQDEFDLLRDILDQKRRIEGGLTLAKGRVAKHYTADAQLVKRVAGKLLNVVKEEINHAADNVGRINKAARGRFLRDNGDLIRGLHIETAQSEKTAKRAIKRVIRKAASQEELREQLLRIHNLNHIAKNYFSPKRAEPVSGFFMGVAFFFEKAVKNCIAYLMSFSEVNLQSALEKLGDQIEKYSRMPKEAPVDPLKRQETLEKLADETRDRVRAEIKDANTYYALTVGEIVRKYSGVETDAIGSGSEGCFADEIEWRALNRFKIGIESGKERLSETDQKRFYDYYHSVERGRQINQALEAFYNKLESDPPPTDDEIRDYLKIFKDEIYAIAVRLKEGESLFLNMGHYNHAFRIGISKKEEGKVELSLYEPGVGLEASLLSHSGLIPGLGASSLNECGYPVHTAIKIVLTQEEFEQKGELFIHNMLHRATLGMQEDREAQDPIAYKIAELEQKIESYEGWNFLKKGLMKVHLKYLQIKELIPYRAKWGKTIAAFSAIAPDRVALVPMLHRSQRIGMCATKRVRISQLHELGFTIFQKINEQIQTDIKDQILQEFASRGNCINSTQQAQLRDLQIRKQDKAHLRAASKRLAELDRIPPYPDVAVNIGDDVSPRDREQLIKERQLENFEAAKSVILLINHQLAQLRKPHIVDRSSFKTIKPLSYREVMLQSVSDADLAEAVKIKGFAKSEGRQRHHGIAIRLGPNDELREITKEAYLALVLERPSRLFDPDIASNVDFILSGVLTIKERKLAKAVEQHIKSHMIPSRDGKLIKALANLHELDDKISEEIKRVKALHGSGIPEPVLGAYYALLEVKRLEVQAKIIELQDFNIYLSKPASYESMEEAKARMKNRSFAINSYFEADELSKSALFLTQSVSDFIRKMNEEVRIMGAKD